jgi:Domain of unknown function (DUF5753)
MPDDGQRSVVERFREDLNELCLRAGSPTLGQLARLSEKLYRHPRPDGFRPRHLATSTTSDILSGNRANLPEWGWVASFVTAVAGAAAEGKVMLGPPGTLDYWKLRYEAAQRDFKAAGRRAQSVHPAAMAGAEPGSAPSPWIPSEEISALQRATMLDDARLVRTMSWWVGEFGDVVPTWFEAYLGLESIARQIRVYEPSFVPGLLQTEEYARAVLAQGPRADIERCVDLRMRRQRALRGPKPARLWAILDEVVLRSPAIDPGVMHAQLEYLRRMAERPNVTIQIMPAGLAEDLAGAAGPIALLRFHSGNHPDVVYLEQLHGALYPESLDEVHRYNQVLDGLAIGARKPRDTQGLLGALLLGLNGPPQVERTPLALTPAIETAHRAASAPTPSSRAISMRWTSLVPSPISRILASR